MVGMGVTIVLILAVGGVGVWYWLRIKETSSHEKVEDKTPPRIPQEPIFGEDLINSGDIKVDEIKKTSPPAEEPQSESQSPEETIEEVQEVLLKETEEEEEPVETSPVLEEIDAGQYSRVTVEKGQAVRMKEFGAELVEVAAIEDRPQAMTAAESGAGENFAGKAQNFDAG